jgi:methylmalonyl-CoA mutase
MSQPLFQEFEDVTAKQWKQKIQFDLKGADYNEKLIYKSRDGVDVKPFYTAEDIEETSTIPSPQHWDICEKIFVASVEISNRRAQDVLNKGAESLWFIIPSEETNIEKLLQDLPLQKISLHLEFQFLSEKYLKELSEILKGKSAEVFLHLDIIGNLARSGNWYSDLRNDHEVIERILQQETFTSALSIGCRPLSKCRGYHPAAAGLCPCPRK